MSTVLDKSIGFVEEATYGAGGTIVRWLEFLEAPIDDDPTVVDGGGSKVGALADRSDRSVQVAKNFPGTIKLEALSKGLGLLWKWALGGDFSSTLVSGTTYQQLHTPGDTLKSFALQEGIPTYIADAVHPYTFKGGMITEWELAIESNGLATVTFGVNFRDLDTATGLTAVSYASGGVIYSWPGLTVQTGTLTVPTGNALGSLTGASEIKVRKLSLKYTNNLDLERRNSGGALLKDAPVPGKRELAVTFDLEYLSNTVRDAQLGRTSIPLLITLTGGALSTGTETLQVAIPDVRGKGIPKATEGTTGIVQSFDGKAYLTGASKLLYVATRTSDTAL